MTEGQEEARELSGSAKKQELRPRRVVGAAGPGRRRELVSYACARDSCPVSAVGLGAVDAVRCGMGAARRA